MDIAKTLASEFSVAEINIKNIISLIDEGNTIPFIARYRKEAHGGLDDQVLREVADRLAYLQNLVKRKEEVENSIKEQEKWTDELEAQLLAAKTLTEVEDIYRPYKPKKKTRASVAIAKGLEPLADIIAAQQLQSGDVNEVAAPFVDEEKGVSCSEEALQGACDIIAERISDDANIRKTLRKLFYDIGVISVKLEPKKEDNPKKEIYEMYKDYSEPVAKIPPHRVLAINRGENDECLKVNLIVDENSAAEKIRANIKKDSIFNELIESTILDSYKRLIAPSIENEVRGELTDVASEQAIKMFEVNLKPLLMQPPLRGKVILGLDPGYRTGCKLAVIDSSGNVLYEKGDADVIFVTMGEGQKQQAKKSVLDIIKKYGVSVISIGNGTASKETEIFVAELIKENNLPLSYAVVNESGASVYSASKLGAEEFPQFDVTKRGAISIARRLLDPLAELIKIDVKSIGVGQYQHDMPQKRLTDILTGVVEDCVNAVGVDLNTASYSLLSYISGLNLTIAKNIVEQRKKARFTSRDELKKVAKLGPKAFEQCAGFLRIPDSDNLLDNTSVHPESYSAAKKLITKFDFPNNNIDEKTREYGIKKLAQELEIGEPTLVDIINEILKPGRDIRDSLPPAVLRADLMDIKDLKEGMQLEGVVRNVIDFGAFIDIGVHCDGLVHISQITNRFIKHPSEVLSVGQSVKVKVLSVDVKKERIGLTMKDGGEKEERSVGNFIPLPKGRGVSGTATDGVGSEKKVFEPSKKTGEAHFARERSSPETRGERNGTNVFISRSGAEAKQPATENETLDNKLKQLMGKFGR